MLLILILTLALLLAGLLLLASRRPRRQRRGAAGDSGDLPIAGPIIAGEILEGSPGSPASASDIDAVSPGGGDFGGAGASSGWDADPGDGDDASGDGGGDGGDGGGD